MRIFCVIFLLLSFVGCGASSKNEGPAVRIDSIRPEKPEEIEAYEVKVSKSAYKKTLKASALNRVRLVEVFNRGCLLYTSPSPRDKRQSRMPSSA